MQGEKTDEAIYDYCDEVIKCHLINENRRFQIGLEEINNEILKNFFCNWRGGIFEFSTAI